MVEGDYNLYAPPKQVSLKTDHRVRLFNVSADIGEHHDVSKEHPDIVKELIARLDAYDAQAPAAGTDPAASPQCVAQKPPKHSFKNGPGGASTVTPYCNLHETSEVLI